MSSDPSRHWGDEVRAAIGGLMPVVFAAMGSKRVAARKAGFEVDVWVDDRPEWVDGVR